MSPDTRRLRIGLGVVGVFGLLIHWRFLASTLDEFAIQRTDIPDFLYISAGESRFLLMHMAVALPSCLALLVATSGRLARWVDAKLEEYVKYDPRQYRTAAVAFTLILFALFRVGRSLVLYDLPITDDENGVMFGARILASGHLRVPSLQPEGAFLDLFTHTRDGQVASFDWPGGLLVTAAGVKVGLGPHLFALIGAIGGTATVAAVHRWLGPREGLLAAAVIVCSPLALGLSLTMHPHVVSRTCIALAILAYARMTTRKDDEDYNPWLTGAGLGVAAGLAFMSRPFESATLLAPVAVHLLWRAAKSSPQARQEVLGALLGFAIPLALFAYYNAQMTGSALLPPRFDRTNTRADPMPDVTFDTRVSIHVSHNLMLLALYMLGPLALPVAAIGAVRRSPHYVVLGAGVVLNLMLMLGHDNIGIHVVGPIHCSDAAPALAVLFVAGVVSIEEWIEPVVSRAVTRWVAFGYTLVGIGLVFTLPWLGQLQRHGEFVSRPYDFLAAKGVHNAIVIAPEVFVMRPIGTIGSWQLHMPHPDPLLEDDLIFALGLADADALHRKYPGRNIVKIVVDPRTRALDLVEIHSAVE